MLGKVISHYKILDHLGGGGMGVVYRGQDLRLGRTVALKFLPDELSKDAHAMERFQREARSASALNHPNICTIFDIGKGTPHVEGEPQDQSNPDALDFIVMEFLDGLTLKYELASGSMDLDRLMNLGVQIADALDAAHSEGILHRDIKPANIFITKRGQAKVMDFGLAKLAIHPRATAPENSALETQGAQYLTNPGMAVGTVAYMSPEQARAEDLDPRTDLFSFGIVLYEMATGKQPFAGNSTAVIFDAILNKMPIPPIRLNPLMPQDLDRIIMKALEKNRDLRYQSAAELCADLKRLKRDSDSSHQSAMHSAALVSTGAMEPNLAANTTAATKAPEKKWTWAIGIGLGILVVGVAFTQLNRSTNLPKESLPQIKFTRLTDQGGQEADPSISPDGNYVIYRSGPSDNFDIYLQRIGGRNPINLTKDSPLSDSQPAYSPDGQRIAFRSNRDGGGIFLMGATGESVRRLTDFGFRPAWSPDGKKIIFSTVGPVTPLFRGAQSKLWVVDVTTEQKKMLHDGDAVEPACSPNNLRIAFWSLSNSAGGQRDIATIPASGGTPLFLTNDGALDWSPIWSPDGKYLYFASDRGGSMNVWRIAIDEQSGKALSEPEPMTTPSSWSGELDISKDGTTLLFSSTDRQANIESIAFDPATENATAASVPVTSGSVQYSYVAPSEDGEWLVFGSVGQQEDLFVSRSDGTELRQLTNDLHKDRGPAWSPDGSRIAFYSDRTGRYEFWVIKAGWQRPATDYKHHRREFLVSILVAGWKENYWFQSDCMCIV